MSEELKEYWCRYLVRNLDDTIGSDLIVGSYMEISIHQFTDTNAGTNFAPGSIASMLERCLRIRGRCLRAEGRQVDRDIEVEFIWEDIQSITFVHRCPSPFRKQRLTKLIDEKLATVHRVLGKYTK